MKEAEALDKITAAMRGAFRIETVLTFTHGVVLQVYSKPEGGRAYRKCGPVLVPNEGESVADVLRMLGDLRDGAEVRRRQVRDL